jgi:nicotinate-nucleotide pyrophosphorylase (carboxylating)
VTADALEAAGRDTAGRDTAGRDTAVGNVVARALAEDLGPDGDLTSVALVPADLTATANVVARADGVLAGSAAAAEVFTQVDSALAVTWHRADGERLDTGDRVATVVGRLRPILTAERTALNLLCHLSGVATLTRRYVDATHAANPATTILDTRKTLPGLRALQKAAVVAGGGANHRSSLSEAVLVKDNHLGVVTIAAAVEAARARWPGRMVEVECDTLDQVKDAVTAGADRLLLDNMSPDGVAEAAALVAGAVPIEVSGGIGLDNVAAYAAAGADFVSVGALTHSAPALDLALDVTPAPGEAPA